MVLDAIGKLRQAGQGLLVAVGLGLVGLGCVGAGDEARHARIQNEKMDWLDKTSKEAQARNDLVATSRSQSPGIVPPPDVVKPATPTVTPVASIAPIEANGVNPKTEAQVRVVATIGTTPIYEREVREAVYQRLPEIINLPPHARKAKEKELFNEELRRMVERELILDELFALLGQKKQAASLKQLKEAAAKEADGRLKDIQKRANLASDDDMKLFLQGQGLTLSGIRRHFERGFMMQAYLSERLKPKVSNVSLADVKDYYETHPADFQVADRVKWQDLFIRVDRFRSRSDAKKYTDWLLARGVKGDDFAKLINEFDMGDSKSRGGLGFGEEKGKVFPPEMESSLFALKQGQSAIVEFENGFHIVRAAERTLAGTKPFDDRVQDEIRRKLSGLAHEREYKKIVETLWRRSQPQILVD